MKIKKKELITIIIIAVVLAAILFGATYLAGRRGKSTDGKPINLYRPIWQDKLIYDHNGIHVINSEIPDIKELPIDLSAYGIDSTQQGVLWAGNVDGLYLYFGRRNYIGSSDAFQFYRYNLLTAETSMILSSKSVSFPMFDSSSSSSLFLVNSHYNFYAHGGYLYYFGYNHPDYLQGSADISKNLCRVPVQGGKEEVITEYEDMEEYIRFVDGDTVITSNRSSVYAYDVSKRKKTELFNAEKNGFRLILTERSYYYDGKLYFLAEKDLPSVAEADEGFKEDWKTPDDYLIALDIKNKKWKKAVDGPVSLFCVTEDRIYYIRKKYRLIPISEFAISMNDVLTVYCDDSICSQPIGGGEKRVHYTNDKISFNEIFTIKDGKFCGRINSPTETEYDYSIKFAVIDFSSGIITTFYMPE